MYVIAHSFLNLRGYDQNASETGILLDRGEALLLEREPDNAYDGYAVTAKTFHTQTLIGRVAQEHSKSFFRILQATERLGVKQQGFFISRKVEDVARRDGSTYKSTRINVKVTFFLESLQTDLQNQGLSSAANGGTAAVLLTKAMQKKTVYSRILSDNPTVNELIKAGQWKDSQVGVVVDGMTFADLKEAVGRQYSLKEKVQKRLVICYYIREEGVDKLIPKHIVEDDDVLPDFNGVEKCSLLVRFKAGELR